MTTRIYLWGGPGSGKSTLAAETFAAAKRAGASIELVREYAKELVWEGRPLNQEQLLAEQRRREDSLVGKVDYLITDSPWPFGAVYGAMYGAPVKLLAYIRHEAQEQYDRGLTHHVFVQRNKPFVQAGRNETEKQARQVDRLMRAELEHFGIVPLETDSTQTGAALWAQLTGDRI